MGIGGEVTVLVVAWQGSCGLSDECMHGGITVVSLVGGGETVLVGPGGGKLY